MNRLSENLTFDYSDRVSRKWAEDHWNHWEAQNRFSITPCQRTYAVGKWPQDARDHYAALFDPKWFPSLPDFIAYDFFHASILQTVVRDARPDGSWFRLEEKGNYAKRLLRFLSSVDRFLTAPETTAWLRTWELPEELEWLDQLGYVQSVAQECKSDVTLWAETTQGYLVFLVING
jgi:hypothetical protein